MRFIFSIKLSFTTIIKLVDLGCLTKKKKKKKAVYKLIIVLILESDFLEKIFVLLLNVEGNYLFLTFLFFFIFFF